MKISHITATHIKGIDHIEISCNLYPNCPNFLVAPNGAGKSSLAAGFQSLKRNGLRLNDNCLFQGEEWGDSELSIVLENEEAFSANVSKNEISELFDVEVINSGLHAKQTIRQIGGRSIAEAKLCVPDVVIRRTIPRRNPIRYSISTIRESYPGSLKKLLFNFSKKFDSLSFLQKICDNNCFFTECNGPGYSNLINNFLNDLRVQKGTKDNILNLSIDCSEISKVRPLRRIAELISQEIDKDVEHYIYLNAIQINRFCINNKSSLKKRLDWLKYEKNKRDAKDLLMSLNTTGLEIEMHERKNKGLVLELPDRSRVSNGELDILHFAGKLIKTVNRLSKKALILVIDEVFDYLDDANLLIAQYYLLEMIDKVKHDGGEIYPILLTHLDPSSMTSYRFRAKHVAYFGSPHNKRISGYMSSLLYDRDRISRDKNPTEAERKIYEEVSSAYLHFNPTAQASENILTYLRTKGIPESMIAPMDFARAMEREIHTYKAGQEYDATKVCCALRHAVEYIAYSQLPENAKNDYPTSDKTQTRLEYAENAGVTIPDIFYLLGSLYNGCMHLNNERHEEILIYRKLNNLVIKGMVMRVFETLESFRPLPWQ